MARQALVTLSSEVAWLLDQIGYAKAADKIAHKRGEQRTPWLSREEHHCIHRLLSCVPERGGPAIAFDVPLGRTDRTDRSPESQALWLQFTRPVDAPRSTGSIRFWMDALAGAQLMGRVIARPAGGRPSALDLSACLINVQHAIVRCASNKNVDPPREPARCVAALLWLFAMHGPFHVYVRGKREKTLLFRHKNDTDPFSVVLRIDAARSKWLAQVAETERGVMPRSALSRLAKEVRSLARDRSASSVA